MNHNEIINGLLKITKEQQDACKAEINMLGKNHPTERGALQLKAGIYNVAIAAGLIGGTDRSILLMSKRFANLIKFFPELESYYRELTGEEKENMEIALYPEIFMRLNFYNTYNNDLEAAERFGDPQKIFQARIKKEVLCEILEMWRNFRVENDLFAFAFNNEEV